VNATGTNSVEPAGAVGLCAFTPRQIARQTATLKIWEESPLDKGKVGYAALWASMLPHSDPGDVPAWSRRDGHRSVIIRPGARANPDGSITKGGIPFGQLARKILIGLISTAIKTRNPKIALGHSMAAFLRGLGLRTDGRSGWGVRRQLIRLLGAAITYDYADDYRFGTENISIADEYMLWWSPAAINQATLWESHITLNGRLFEDILAHGFPVDLRAIRLLRSSLALDLYVWCACRVSRLREPLRLSWRTLHGQFGADYACAEINNFRRHAISALFEVVRVWPGFEYGRVRGGIVLHPCALPVPRISNVSKARTA